MTWYHGMLQSIKLNIHDMKLAYGTRPSAGLAVNATKKPCLTALRNNRCTLEPTNALRWRHSKLDDVSNHRRLDCLLSSLFRRRSKKISKLRVTGLCKGISPVTGEFPAQRASNAEFFFIWWRHHVRSFQIRHLGWLHCEIIEQRSWEPRRLYWRWSHHLSWYCWLSVGIYGTVSRHLFRRCIA